MPPRLAPPARNPADVEAAFEAAPAEMVAEILEGELHLSPRPRPGHALAATVLGVLLGGRFRGTGPDGWTFLDEPELHLGRRPDKGVPDLAAWRGERLPDQVFDEDAPVGITVVPDWVCEVISKGTERVDRGRKSRIYRREKVGHMWLVNPVARTLEVYRFEGSRWLLLETYEGDEAVAAEPFEALEIPLASLWKR